MFVEKGEIVPNQVRSVRFAHRLRQIASVELAILIFSFASFATVGLSLVVTSWIAAINGSISLVGQLFFTSSATSLAFSIYAGAITDRKNRLSIIRWGQSLKLLAVAALAVGVLGSHPIPWLFVYAALFSIGTALNAGALDGIVQRAVGEQRRMKLSIRVSICRQVGILCGTGAGGISLHYFPAIWSVSIMAILMLVQFIIISRFFASYQNAPSKSPQDIISTWKEGLLAIAGQRTLAFTILTIGLFFSASQMANVLVPGFVKETLQRGSDVYGLLETSWAVGGGAILITAAAKSKMLTAHRSELVILMLVGAAMVVFAASRSIPLLVILYALLGGLFALGRAICDGRILILAKNEEIGRVRATTSMAVSLLGMAIYISPTAIGSENAIHYYTSWGVLIALVGAIMLALNAYFEGEKREE